MLSEIRNWLHILFKGNGEEAADGGQTAGSRLSQAQTLQGSLGSADTVILSREKERKATASISTPDMEKPEPQSLEQIITAPKESVPSCIPILEDNPTVSPAAPQLQKTEGGGSRRISQEEFEHDLVARLGPHITIQNKDDISQLNGRVPTDDELLQACQEIARNTRIPFSYIHDGCYARAHVMCETLRKSGINRAKIFAFGDLHAKNKYMDANWWYHVAPLVFATNPHTQKVEGKVLDPGLSESPLTPDQWIQMISSSSVRVDITKETQYQPRESNPEDATLDERLPEAWAKLDEYKTAFESMHSD